MASRDDLETLLATHNPPADGLYPIRGVVLFGLAECERSRLFADLLRAGRIDDIGQLMCTSHDGDRVAYLGEDEQMHPFQPQTSNGYLLDLSRGPGERRTRTRDPGTIGVPAGQLPL